MKKLIPMTIALLLAAGCTDAKFEKMTNFGNSASIQCYSGAQVIYDGRSTGKIKSEENSDGYYFKEKQTGNLKEVSGNCIITYD